ncbi:MAG: beta-lactamase family protein [Oscillospiraceae bacterium]|nr:beta-lactamase family protein [Oscillospiraceae bacterium]
MSTQIIAWILSFLSFFMVWNSSGQPNSIPETRVSPFGDELPPDKYKLWPTEEFALGSPRHCLSPKAFEAFYALKGIIDGGSKTEGLLVLHKGRLIYENYAEGWDKDTPHWVASVTKSVTATLVGIAIYEGHIGSIKDKVLDYFPEAEDLIPAGDSKRDMTIEHLLTMTSGLWMETQEEWDGFFAEDQTDSALYAFLLPQKAAPGETYYYDSAVSSILLGIVAQAAKRDLLEYAWDRLFTPLGISSVVWDTAADGLPFGGFGIEMTPRDMLRLGYLYLNYGRWDDRQIFDPVWAAQAGPRAMSTRAYGHSFWNNELLPFFGFYEADGMYGQFISIYPKWDLVVVRTGDRGQLEEIWDGVLGLFQ